MLSPRMWDEAIDHGERRRGGNDHDAVYLTHAVRPPRVGPPFFARPPLCCVSCGRGRRQAVHAPPAARTLPQSSPSRTHEVNSSKFKRKDSKLPVTDMPPEPAPPPPPPPPAAAAPAVLPKSRGCGRLHSGNSNSFKFTCSFSKLIKKIHHCTFLVVINWTRRYIIHKKPNQEF